MSKKSKNTEKKYPVINIDGNEVLTTHSIAKDNPIISEAVKKGEIFTYSVRIDDESSDLVEITLETSFNRAFDIICLVPFNLNQYGCFYPKETKFLHKALSVESFLRRNKSKDQE